MHSRPMRNQTNELKESLENAVHRQLMTDVPYGVLLSGGLDSSVIAAIAAKYSKKRIESKDVSQSIFHHDMIKTLYFFVDNSLSLAWQN